jgi:hypothetical protein
MARLMEIIFTVSFSEVPLFAHTLHVISKKAIIVIILIIRA